MTTTGNQASSGRVRAFVLSGGGARGALQAGAVRALVEAGIEPDLLVGTSIGAVNATHLAVHGWSPAGLDLLDDTWRDAAAADMMRSRLEVVVRRIVGGRGWSVRALFRQFLIDHGVDPTLRFGAIDRVRLILVAADLIAARPVLYGADPDDVLLEGVLASTAILPWFRPLARNGRLLVDGSAVSDPPIEPALCQGATDIVVLDLVDHAAPADGNGPRAVVEQLVHTMKQRQFHLEMQLAAARGVPVHYVELSPGAPVAMFEFPRAVSLIQVGYERMCDYLHTHPELAPDHAPPVPARHDADA